MSKQFLSVRCPVGLKHLAGRTLLAQVFALQPACKPLTGLAREKHQHCGESAGPSQVHLVRFGSESRHVWIVGAHQGRRKPSLSLFLPQALTKARGLRYSIANAGGIERRDGLRRGFVLFLLLRTRLQIAHDPRRWVGKSRLAALGV